MNSRVPPRSDVLLALFIGALVVLEVAVSPAVAPKLPAVVTELLVAAAVAFRRSGPVLAALLVSIGTIAEAASGVPINEPFVPLLGFVIVAYSIASYAPVREAILGLVILLVGMVGMTLAAHAAFGNALFGMVFLGAFGVMGATVRKRTAEAANLAREAALAEQQVAEASRRAREEERTRIAREIHDVVAHSVSVMVVQAGAAEQVVRTDPGSAMEPLQAIQETGREALGEMSALLGVLRDGGEEFGLAPQPGMERLPALIEDARATGLSVEFAVSGAEREVPPGIGLTVYRVVQEALTNTRKHSGPVPVTVALEYRPESVEVSVVDSGSGGHAVHRGGHGLVGMRERAEMYGGTLTAGPEPTGGYAVRLSLPMSVSAPTADLPVRADDEVAPASRSRLRGLRRGAPAVEVQREPEPA